MTFLGIDVSKDTFDVFVAGGDTSRLSNKPGEVLGLANRLKNVSLVVLEALVGMKDYFSQAC